MCWKKSTPKRLKAINHNPGAYKWWADLEKEYSDLFGKDKISCSDLRKMHEGGVQKDFTQEEFEGCICV